MPREKPNYRDMVAEYKSRGLPDMVSQKQAMEILGIGHSKFERLKKEGHITLKAGVVAIGDIARLTC